MTLAQLLPATHLPLLDQQQGASLVDPVVEVDEAGQGLAGEDEPSRFPSVDEPRFGLLVVAENLLAARVFGIHGGGPVRECVQKSRTRRRAYQSAERSVNATPGTPPAPGLLTCAVCAGILLTCVALLRPATADPVPTEGPVSPRGPNGVAVQLGNDRTALLYRPTAASSEAIVLLEGPEAQAWPVLTRALLDRGVNVLLLSAAAAPSSVTASFRFLRADLGDDAVIGLAAEGTRAAAAWMVARALEPAATLLVGAEGELPLHPFLFAPERAENVLLLAGAEDFMEREAARALFVSTPDRVDLWLIDDGGIGWSGLLERSDLVSDVADWCLRTLENARAVRAGGLAGAEGER